MENNEKWEAVKRRNKTSILQSVNKFREEANKMKRKMQRFVTVSTAAALSLAMAVPGSAAYHAACVYFSSPVCDSVGDA